MLPARRCASDNEIRLADVYPSLLNRMTAIGPDLAVLLVHDRPERVKGRPGVARTHFAQRCLTETEIAQTIEALRALGAYVELFESDIEFIEAFGNGRIAAINRRVKVVDNGVEGGIAPGGFRPGRKALVPAIADAYDLVCIASSAHACSLGRHKYHYFSVLRAHGLAVPLAWHYRPGDGWADGRRPPLGTKVIVKSTYENWSVGVSEASVFVVDAELDDRVARIADEIGQAVCVQEFVSGLEVCVPVFSIPDRFATRPVLAVLDKSPRDPNSVMTLQDNLDSAGVSYEPYDGDAATIGRLRDSAVRAFAILELGGFGRIDFRVDAAGTPWLIDVGVTPVANKTSSSYVSAQECQITHREFIQVIFAASLASQGVI